MSGKGTVDSQETVTFQSISAFPPNHELNINQQEIVISQTLSRYQVHPLNTIYQVKSEYQVPSSSTSSNLPAPPPCLPSIPRL